MPNDDRASNRSGSGTRMSGRTIAKIAVVVLILVFVLQNTEEARVTFLFFDVRTGLWLALIVALLLGAAAGYLIRGRNDKD